MARYLCIVIVFGFCTTQFYDQKDDDMKFLALSIFLVAAPFNGKKKTMIMHCLHIIVVFSFVVVQLYDKEDDDMRFSMSSFFFVTTPFSAKKRMTMMTRYLRIVVIFG